MAVYTREGRVDTLPVNDETAPSQLVSAEGIDDVVIDDVKVLPPSDDELARRRARKNRRVQRLATAVAITGSVAGGYLLYSAGTTYVEQKQQAEAPMPVPDADFAVSTNTEAEKKALLATSETNTRSVDESAPTRDDVYMTDSNGNEILGYRGAYSDSDGSGNYNTPADFATSPNNYCNKPDSFSPNRIYVPTLCMRSTYSETGVGEKGMELPSNASKLAHLNTSAPIDSDAGTSILAGHVNYYGKKGALYDLKYLKPGDRIYITNSKGTPQEFVVTELRSYMKEGLPDSLFSIGGQKRVALVTCGGELLRTDRGYSYKNNVVAYGVAVDELSPTA